MVLVHAFAGSIPAVPAKLEKKSKRSPARATSRIFSLIWLQSTKTLEPISNLFPAQCWLSRAGSAPTPAGARARSPHQPPPLLFLEISPAEFLFFSLKRVFSGGSVSLQATWRCYCAITIGNYKKKNKTRYNHNLRRCQCLAT